MESETDRVAKMKHSLWDKTTPRVVAASALAYLIYALVWRDEAFSYLHILTFLLIVVLVLAPFARRLKIPNLIDFESKFESLREETKKELTNIRNQISTTLEAQISPVQHQWNVISMGEPSVQQLAQSIAEAFRRTTSVGVKNDDKYTLNQFLRKADSYRARTYDILFIAYHMDKAIREQRPFSTEVGRFPMVSTDERINYMISELLNGGVESFVPPNEVAKTTKGLKAVKNLLEIRNKVDSEKRELPSQHEAEELFGKVGDALRNIIAGVALQGWQAILYRYEMVKKLEELRVRYGVQDTPNKE